MNRRDFFTNLSLGVAVLTLKFKPLALPQRSIILGLDPASTDDIRFYSYRRTVFYKYPDNTAPLTGLIDLMKHDPDGIRI